MKVKFKYGIRNYSGTLDEMTYSAFKRGNICIGRKYVKPRYTPQNELLGAILSNLASVWRDTGIDYREDLRTYAQRRNAETRNNGKLQVNAFSFFLKMMYAWHESDPQHNDLTTVTVADLVISESEVCTISGAVAAGFLPPIAEYDDLVSEIQ